MIENPNWIGDTPTDSVFDDNSAQAKTLRRDFRARSLGEISVPVV
jgi:hypothetical protein